MVSIENYECDGCRNDGFTHMGCGDCPHNDERINEYYEKYGGGSRRSRVINLSGFISD